MFAQPHSTSRAVAAIIATGFLVLGGNGIAAPEDDPLSYWNLDEGEGEIATDTGTRVDKCPGTVSDAEWLPVGVGNSSLYFAWRPQEEFKAIVSTIDSAFDDPIETSQVFTIAAWVYWHGEKNPLPPEAWNCFGEEDEEMCRHSYIFDGREAASRDDVHAGFILLVQNGDGLVRLQVQALGADDQIVTSATAVPENRWTHVTAIYENGGSVRIYIDGTLDVEETAQVSYAGSSLEAAIGNNHWAPSDSEWANFNGALDEVRLYDRPLSQLEILILVYTADWLPSLDIIREQAAALIEQQAALIEQQAARIGCLLHGDLDEEGTVGFSDLLILLSHWGFECPAE